MMLLTLWPGTVAIAEYVKLLLLNLAYLVGLWIGEKVRLGTNRFRRRGRSIELIQLIDSLEFWGRMKTEEWVCSTHTRSCWGVHWDIARAAMRQMEGDVVERYCITYRRPNWWRSGSELRWRKTRPVGGGCLFHFSGDLKCLQPKCVQILNSFVWNSQTTRLFVLFSADHLRLHLSDLVQVYYFTPPIPGTYHQYIYHTLQPYDPSSATVGLSFPHSKLCTNVKHDAGLDSRVQQKKVSDPNWPPSPHG